MRTSTIYINRFTINHLCVINQGQFVEWRADWVKEEEIRNILLLNESRADSAATIHTLFSSRTHNLADDATSSRLFTIVHVLVPRVVLAMNLASKTITEIYLSRNGPLRFTNWVATAPTTEMRPTRKGSFVIIIMGCTSCSCSCCCWFGRGAKSKWKDHCLNYEIIYIHLTILTSLCLGCFPWLMRDYLSSLRVCWGTTDFWDKWEKQRIY